MKRRAQPTYSVAFEDIWTPGVWHLCTYPTEQAARAAIESHWDNRGTCKGDVVCKCGGHGNDTFPDTECWHCGYWHPEVRAWSLGLS